jgi:hypothetical protein
VALNLVPALGPVARTRCRQRERRVDHLFGDALGLLLQRIAWFADREVLAPASRAFAAAGAWRRLA